MKVEVFLDGSVGKESSLSAGDTGDMGSIFGLERCPGEGHGNPLQYSCLENPIDTLFIFMHWRRKWQPTPVFLPGESQGQGSLVGCHL